MILCRTAGVVAFAFGISVALAQTAPFEGKNIADIRFKPVQPLDPADLAKTLDLKKGDALRSDAVARSIDGLFATGRFEDITVEAEPSGNGVALTFTTQPAWFVGNITVQGKVNAPPNRAQIAGADQLSLGTPFHDQDITAAAAAIKQLLISNGLYGAEVSPDVRREEQTQAVYLTFTLQEHKRAKYEMPAIKGMTLLPDSTIVHATGWRIPVIHWWRKVTEARTTGGVRGVLGKYEKQDRLTAKVDLEKLDYDNARNTVQPTLSITPGPKIKISAVETKVSQRVLKRYVPAFEERAVYNELLVEGQRNLEDYFQSQGYYDAQVDFRVLPPANDVEKIEYAISRGQRYKLVRRVIQGSHYFSAEDITERLFLQPAAFTLRHGRYSEAFRRKDEENVIELYRSNGFHDVKVNTEVDRNYLGKSGNVAVTLHIDEGPQWLVDSLEIKGVAEARQADLESGLASKAGQPFADANLASDRSYILDYYYARGFANATMQAAWAPSGKPNRVTVVYNIQEGIRQYVRDVLVSGLRTTRRSLVDRTLRIRSGDPLSPVAQLDAQQRLYNLGVFARVDTAIQNPDGAEDHKYLLYSFEEANRYRLDVGFGAQVANFGTPSTTSLASPGGTTGFSPQVSLDLQRLDLLGLGHTIALRAVDLARVRNVQQRRPGLRGSVRLSADGSLALGAESPRVLLTGLNASLTTSNLAENGNNLGNLDLSAHTTSGNRLDFKLASNIAGSTVQATGNGELGGDYPVSAQLSFGGVRWSHLAPLLGRASAGSPPAFEATAEGKVSVDGPVRRMDQLRGSLELTRLAIQTLPRPGEGKPVAIENQGTVSASLDRGAVRLDRFHFVGPQTDVQASGTVGVSSQTLDLMVNAGIDLAVLRNFSRDLVSSGNVKLASALRGTISNPQADGRLDLQSVTLNTPEFPNGLANANGVVLLRGSRATIQNLTAESGGGKIALKGFASLAPNFEFALTANASGVRVRVQEGVRVMMSGDLHLAGNTGNSTASGALTLEQFDYAPHSDLGSMLQRALPQVQNRSTPSPLLDNMKLDLRVRTSPATRVQASLAENLQIDADLRVRGSPSEPAVLGRINLTQGRLIFFGSTYTINAGNISFFNPLRIDPVLNLSLETQSKGVDVTLNVTGPVDNMKLTYTSNPPLQFQEIVSLLSAGTTPTSDPTLLANQPSPPQQTLQQRGESAILGEAVANPVSNRLQRVFGVTQLKIDPAFTGSSQLPTAQLTLQEQVSKGLTFTYVSALDNPNSTLVRAEWALNRQWAATAVRDQNGIFSINLLYKKQFR